MDRDIPPVEGAVATTASTKTLLRVVKDWEYQVATADDRALEDMFERWKQMGQRLKEEQKQRQQVTSRKDKVALHKDSSTSTTTCPIPPEVLRQVLPFLTAPELGRWLVLTNKSFMEVLGKETVWKAICETMWPNSKIPNKHSDVSSYQWYFQQRQKPVVLAAAASSETVLPKLAKNKTSTSDWTLVVDVWRDNERLVSQTILSDQLDALCIQATVTVDLETPIEAGRLSRPKGHGWNLPKTHEGWKARLQLFRNNQNQEKESPSPASSSSSSSSMLSHVLLDTSFSWWRGWSHIGELTFLQRERNRGLELTDRGQWVQHRIVRAKSPQWQGYLGFQCKVTLVCETTGEDDGDDMVRFDFTKVRIEAIRLHENAHGNITHNLFRKDEGWQKHGVELLNLIEELR
jgi:hypothetical protein